MIWDKFLPANVLMWKEGEEGRFVCSFNGWTSAKSTNKRVATIVMISTGNEHKKCNVLPKVFLGLVAICSKET